MNNTSVSIIITTYNRNALLKRSLQSAIDAAKVPYPCQIVVVDDSPNQHAKTIVESYSNISDLEISYLSSQGGGANLARNLGIKNSTGKYIALLDDDDEFTENKIKDSIDFLNHNPAYKWVFGSCDLIVSNEKRFTKCPKYKHFLNYIINIYNPISLPSTFIDRVCFDTCGYFDESLPSYQDWDMWFRIGKKFKIGAVQNTVCIIHQEHNKGRIGLNKNAIYGYRLFRQKHYSSMSFIQKRLHNHIYSDNIKELKKLSLF